MAGPLVRQAFLDPPFAGFLQELEEGIVNSLCLTPPADPQARIQEIINVARLLVRHNNGLLALNELAAQVGPEVENRLLHQFGGRTEVWEQIKDRFVEKLARIPLRAERAAEIVAFATVISRRLMLDLIRQENARPRAESARDEAGEFRDLLDQVSDESWTPTAPEFPSTKAALAAIQLQIRQLGFRFPPNPPYQTITWAHSVFLKRGPKRMIGQGLVDRPLSDLLNSFLLNIPRDKLTARQWAVVTAPLRDSLNRPVGAVLEERVHRRAYERLLSRKCGDTCLREYAFTEPSARKGSVIADPDAILEGNLADWTLKVNRRIRHEMVRVFFDSQDEHDGTAGIGASQ